MVGLRRRAKLIKAMAILMVTLLVSWMSSWAVAAPVALPSGETIELTPEQVEALKSQPGLAFSQNAPEALPPGHTVIALPEELGGGFVSGTAADLATALNGVGATMGMTAAAITGTSGLSTGAMLGIGAGIAAAAGAAAAALSGDGTTTTTAHH